jgi:hypothetical protein
MMLRDVPQDCTHREAVTVLTLLLRDHLHDDDIGYTTLSFS